MGTIQGFLSLSCAKNIQARREICARGVTFFFLSAEFESPASTTAYSLFRFSRGKRARWLRKSGLINKLPYSFL